MGVLKLGKRRISPVKRSTLRLSGGGVAVVRGLAGTITLLLLLGAAAGNFFTVFIILRRFREHPAPSQSSELFRGLCFLPLSTGHHSHNGAFSRTQRGPRVLTSKAEDHKQHELRGVSLHISAGLARGTAPMLWFI